MVERFDDGLDGWEIEMAGIETEFTQKGKDGKRSTEKNLAFDWQVVPAVEEDEFHTVG